MLQFHYYYISLIHVFFNKINILLSLSLALKLTEITHMVSNYYDYLVVQHYTLH